MMKLSRCSTFPGVVIITALLPLALACAPDGPGTDVLAPQFAKGAATPAPTFYVSNAAELMFRADGAFLEPATSAFAGLSRYQDGECGVETTLFTDGSGDATLGTAGSQAKRCVQAPRKARIQYMLINADGSTSADGAITTATFLNVRQLHRSANPANYIPVGATALRSLAFADGNYKCGTDGTGAVLFNEVTSDGTVTGADRVQVQRTAADTWIVSTLPDEVDAETGAVTHHDKAWCRANGQLYHMPLHLVVKNGTPLSP